MTTPRPENVGILAMEMYFPKRFVLQSDLEAADGCAGKYTVGLGQDKLAFVDDREDIGSVMLSAFSSLLSKYNIDPASIGRLEVGTETLIDKSKSIKTTLMQLLGENTNVEGVSSVNACYGGSAALFNSVAWVQSEDWDGRYAVVVAGDIAVYETPAGQKCGAARATQGCGVVAMLIGPDAPLVMEPGLRSTLAMDVYDFYKPHHSEYAAVDGALSQKCYLKSVDTCYRGFQTKAQAKGLQVDADSIDFFCFHSPYNKLVQKGFARLFYVDFVDGRFNGSPEDQAALAAVDPKGMTYEASLEDRKLDAALRGVSESRYATKMAASAFVSTQLGNCYTGAVFVNLLSLVDNQGQGLEGKRIGMFSYGSGSLATFYPLVARATTSGEFSLARIQATVGLKARLEARTQVTVEEFSAAMELRAQRYGNPDYVPTGPLTNLLPGTFYLAAVNEKHHRSYERA